METIKVTSREYFKSMNLIFIAFITAQVVFALIAFSTGPRETGQDSDIHELYKILAPLLVFSGIIGSFIYSKSKLTRIRAQVDLKRKLVEYRTMHIVKFSLIEGPSFFAIVCFLQTGYYSYFVLTALALLALMFHFPGKEKTATELELNAEDRKLIKDPDAEVVILNKDKWKRIP